MADELPRASTELAAANLALSLIKEPAIGGFDEKKRAAARECRLWFGTARDEVLAEDEWNFNDTWTSVSKDTTQSTGTFKNLFVMPADCINVREVAGCNNADWAVENATVNIGGIDVERVVLVSNQEGPLSVRYGKRVTNVALWSAKFLVSFAARLGRYVAPQLQRSISTVDKMDELSKRKSDEAEAADAREQGRGQISRDVSWVTTRRLGGSAR